MINLLTQNSKLKKTSKENNKRIFNFSIPAHKTKSGQVVCPFAKACLKYCYAQKGNYTRFPIVQELMEQKYTITKQDNFSNLMTQEIKDKRADVVRLHDSGDFYSVKYLKKWVEIAQENKHIIFYAYTKSVPFFKKGIEIPKNLKVIFSEGSKKDYLIDTKKDRHARIFNSLEDLTAGGYIDASTNDLNALTDNKKVGLVIH